MASMVQKAPKKYLQMKHCIKAMQNRAKWVGVLYIIAMLAITVLACLQPITFNDGAIGVVAFWKPFAKLTQEGDILGVIVSNAVELAIALLYAIMLLVLLINFINALCHTGWLFKTKASKLYGFNRNMYAMDDIEKLYSSSFKTIVCIFFIIALFVEGLQISLIIAGSLVGVGVLFHFFCGLLAGNTSIFTIDGEIIEEKRGVGTFSVFIRNLFQVLATAAIVFFFVKSGAPIAALVNDLINGGLATRLADPIGLILPVVLIVVMILAIIMVCYALGTTEFDPSGKDIGGRGTFLWCSLLTFILTFCVAVFDALMREQPLNGNLMAITGVSLVAFILEICLRKFPKTKEKNPDDVDATTYLENGVQDDELDNEVVLQPTLLPPVYTLSLPSGQTDGQNA